ncbi:MAG TPA: transglycosylase SLT domain-containing protein [Sporichthya sp.]|jgi:hypothetical protein|nr:transglycosylase SLT domain-containing protein [Sporichthya sp.]
MKRIVATAGLVLALTGCTTSQYLRYVDAVMNGHEAEAKEAALQYEADRADATEGRPCAEWYDDAISAGFTPTEWRSPISTVIMPRESHCQPEAIGPTDDWGLMQIHGTWVPALCRAGIACNRRDLLDPETNMLAARFVFEAQGWQAWATY